LIASCTYYSSKEGEVEMVIRIIILITLYGMGFVLIQAIFLPIAEATGNSDWSNLGGVLACLNPLVFAMLYFAGIAIYRRVMKSK